MSLPERRMNELLARTQPIFDPALTRPKIADDAGQGGNDLQNAVRQRGLIDGRSWKSGQAQAERSRWISPTPRLSLTDTKV